VKRGLLHTHYGYASPPGERSLIERLAIGAAGMLQRQVIQAGFAVRFVPMKLSGRLLDIGSGSGSYLQTMKSLGWDAEGVEPDDKAAELSCKSGLTVRHGTIEESVLPDGYYDVVTMSHVFEHVFDLDAAATRLWQILKPGGLVVSISPNPRSASALHFGAMWSHLDPPRHLQLPTVEGYKRFLTERGFAVSCSSSSRLRRWIVPESVRVRLTGDVDGPAPVFATIISRLLVALRASVMRHAGEEVVCIARKPVK
jgi:SAM-dependent methyltransferase